MSIKTKRQQKWRFENWKLLTNTWLLKLCFVVFIYDIRLLWLNMLSFSTRLFYGKNISFWPAKLSFQSDFADSQQLSRPPLLIVNFCINISQCNWHMITMNAIIFPINTFFVYNTLKILTSPKKINTCSKSTIETQVQGEKHCWS